MKLQYAYKCPSYIRKIWSKIFFSYLKINGFSFSRVFVKKKWKLEQINLEIYVITNYNMQISFWGVMILSFG